MDDTKPRHTVKVWAECDHDQAEFARFLAQEARDNGESAKAAKLETDAAVLADWSTFASTLAPDVPKDAIAVDTDDALDE